MMRPAEYEAMYRVEQTHWWYRALRRHVTRVVAAEARRLGRPPRVLDAGAGTGGMLAGLAGLGDRYGIEIAPEVVAKDAEGAHAIAEGTGDLPGGALLEEVSAKSLVDALARVGGAFKEAFTDC